MREVEQLARTVVKDYGYSSFCRRRALLMPTSVSLIVGGIALSMFSPLIPPMPQSDAKVLGAGIDWLIKLLSKETIETEYAETHIVSAMFLIVFIVAGLMVSRYTRRMVESFQDAHPYIYRELPQEQEAELRRRGRMFQTIGWVIIAVAAAIFGIAALCGVFHTQTTLSQIFPGIVLLIVTPGIWCAEHGKWIRETYRIFDYNCSAVAHRSVYDIDVHEKEPIRSLLLVEKHEFMRCSLRGNTVFACCALLSAAMFFLPTLESPAWWVPLVIGAIIRYCYGRYGVRTVERLFYKVAQEDAKLSIDETAGTTAH